MLWEDVYQQSKEQDVDVKQYFREILQKSILSVMSQNHYFQRVVFQGGTALRLFYGNPRFSEDIDLVLKKKDDMVDLYPLIKKLKKRLLDFFPFLESIEIKKQKHADNVQRFIVSTRGGEAGQNVRIHVELGYVPSYCNTPRVLDFVPLFPAVQVEESNEILADKTTALACREYLKGRDLWDIYFLMHEKKLSVDWDLVDRKVVDYGYTSRFFQRRLGEVENYLMENGVVVLNNELSRFLPHAVFNYFKPEFERIVMVVRQVIKEYKNKG